MKPEDITVIHSFYVAHRQELFTYAVSITCNREAAEDAIHGVFERLFRADRMPTELRPFIFRSIRNAAFDARRHERVCTDSLFDLVTVASDLGQPGDQPGAAADARTLLDQLSPDERETIVLRVYSGLTFQEIADLRGLPLPTVASWHRRGLERLKALLAHER